jgi:diadenylate cyclase
MDAPRQDGRVDNNIISRINSLLTRLQGYLQSETEVVQILIEMALIGAVVYAVFRFLRGTRGARVIKGVALVLIITTLAVKVLGSGEAFARINFLYDNFLGYATLALLIVFQPELRRALVRLGEAKLFRTSGLRRARVIEEVINAVEYLAANKTGALICIEREVGLDGIVEAGTKIDAVVSHELLKTIFWPGSALHDMAVVVRGDRIIAAGVQLPLAEAEQFSSELGSRHRAAYGLSLEADPLVIVVSEETGTISLAERGRLVRNLSVDGLRTLLVRGLGQIKMPDSDDNDTDSGASQAA